MHRPTPQYRHCSAIAGFLFCGNKWCVSSTNLWYVGTERDRLLLKALRERLALRVDLLQRFVQDTWGLECAPSSVHERLLGRLAQAADRELPIRFMNVLEWVSFEEPRVVRHIVAYINRSVLVKQTLRYQQLRYEIRQRKESTLVRSISLARVPVHVLFSLYVPIAASLAPQLLLWLRCATSRCSDNVRARAELLVVIIAIVNRVRQERRMAVMTISNAGVSPSSCL